MNSGLRMFEFLLYSMELMFQIDCKLNHDHIPSMIQNL